MLMRDRLRELINIFVDSEEYKEEDIADYLLANGIIVPHCKVGDTVYAVWRGDVLEAKVFGVRINLYKRIEIFLDLSVREKDDWYTFSKTLLFNHDVFLTKEEAEAVLEGGAE